MAEPGKLLFVTPKSERKLRQLVGAPNTTDYGSDGTAETPQQNIKRKDTNTATAEEVAQKHPFDAEIINKGTEENPQYYVRIFNSGFPDYPYAGWLLVGQYEFEIPATELAITTENGFYVWIIVAYDSTNPPFDISLRLYPWGSSPPEYSSDTAWCETIAQGQLPVTLQTFYDSYIEVRGRWT